MDLFLEYLRAFLCGGLLCLIGQILIDRTTLTPGKDFGDLRGLRRCARRSRHL